MLVASLVLLGGSADGAAHSSWLGPTVLSGPGSKEGRVAVDVDKQGNATVVWPTDDGIKSAFRPAGGEWTAPQPISPVGDSSPDLGTDSAGTATIVWAGKGTVEASTRPLGGAFGSAQTLWRSDAYVSAPRLAVDSAGDAIALWVAYESSRFSLEAAFRSANGQFGQPERIFSTAECGEVCGQHIRFFDVAIDPKGNAIAAWTLETGISRPYSYSVKSAFRAAGGHFGAPETLEDAAGYRGVHTAIDAQGNAIAVWVFLGGSSPRAGVRSAATGAWRIQPIAPLRDEYDTCNCYSTPAIAVDDQGNATAVWTAPWGVQARVLPRGGESWEALQIDALAGDYVSDDPSPVIAFGPRGDLVVAWPRRGNRTCGVLDATVRPAGGAFGPATEVFGSDGGSGCSFDIAVDPQGNATVIAWTIDRRLTTSSVEAVGYDAAGPKLQAVSVPLTGQVGKRLRVSVRAVDVWSKVASTHWRFGDGSSENGSRASHVYRRSGNYRVAVTSTDTLGNSSTTTRTVTISKVRR